MLGQGPTVLVSFVCPFVWEGVLRGWGPYFLPQLFLKVIPEQEEGSSGKSSSPFLLLDLGVMEIRPWHPESSNFTLSYQRHSRNFWREGITSPQHGGDLG